MQSTSLHQTSKPHTSKVIWTGRIITALCTVFLLFDGIMKLIYDPNSIEASAQLGWSEHLLPGIGIVLLICTILYIMPRTAILGAILLTGYLGGATATMVRVGEPFFFSLIFGMLVWLGILLRDTKLRSFMNLRKAGN